MRTKRGAFTCGAVIVKLALRLPAGTVTLGGVTTCPSMLPLKRTSAPPTGAGDVSVTGPVVGPSPRIVADASVSDERLGGGGGLPDGSKVSPVDGACEFSNAAPESIVTSLGTATGAVSTLNVAPVPPAGMTTVGGNEMKSLSLLASDTS